MAGKKKKKNEIFKMDDGDTSEVAGGLDDAPVFDEEDQDDEIEFVDHVELDDEPEDKPDGEAEVTPDPEADGEVKPEVEPEEEQKLDPAEERYLNMVGMITKKDEQIETLVNQVKVLTEKVLQPAPKEEEVPEPLVAPEPPDAEEMEWNEYIDAKIQYSEDLKRYEATIKEGEDNHIKTQTEANRAEELSNIQAIHTKDFADEAEDLPVLKDNEIVRNKWAAIYFDPANAFNTKPDGVFRATRMLKALARKDGIDLLNFGKEPAKETPKKPVIDPEKLKADEKARQERLSLGTMHDSSRDSEAKGVQPSAGMIEAAERMGVPIKAYMESYKKTYNALGGK